MFRQEAGDREPSFINRLITGLLLMLGVALLFSCSRDESKQRHKIQGLIMMFTSGDWAEVYVSKLRLEARPTRSLPLIVGLLDSEERVKIQEPAPVIYPGTKLSPGHGMLLDYDIDWISVRAGWLLEELSFRDFGFREGRIDEHRLLKSSIEWDSSDPGPPPLLPNRSAEESLRRRQAAVAKAKSWWKENGGTFDRFQALLQALRSAEPRRQLHAIIWIGIGEVSLSALDMASFQKDVVPELERLIHSQDAEVREQARLLLEDKEGYWLSHRKRYDVP